MGSSRIVKTYLLVTEKPWHKDLYRNLVNKFPDCNWLLISKRNEFTLEELKALNPIKIFIPHWSYIIPSDIFKKYECIVFHMTDLPYGRGGSPLQNLIVRGHKTTKISALKVQKEIDAGDIYLKNELSLDGTAQQIFQCASIVIYEMIQEIIEKDIVPYPQKGNPVFFNRRTPEMSNLGNLKSQEKMFDYIRMLDAEGYPNAFIENNYFKFEFTNAKKKGNKIIEANVRIIKK